jgi:signal transduction histidine kinase
MTTDFNADVLAISEIAAVPTILEVVCRTTGMGFAAVARVTEDRWIACGVRDEIDFGLQPGGELKIETTICNEIRDSRQAVIIDSVDDDPIFRTHHTPAIYGLKSYISMPIILPNGDFFGTLCAIDVRPMRLNTPETVGMFKLFADLIAFHLEAHQRVAVTEAHLSDERRSNELREQFIAVLGHDLRNPLAAVDAGARMLGRQPLDEKGRTILGRMVRSIDRMSGLITDVMDFARGRLGSGLGFERQIGVEINPMLEQVVSEMRALSPDRVIEANFIDSPVLRSDPGRIGQLLSNLIGNALTHGAPEGPIRVWTALDDNRFELSVANGGTAIPADVIKDLFKPFFRASGRSGQEGLGLGLYIASEIARGHNGDLSVVSSDEETRFSFRMPID